MVGGDGKRESLPSMGADMEWWEESWSEAGDSGKTPKVIPIESSAECGWAGAPSSVPRSSDMMRDRRQHRWQPWKPPPQLDLGMEVRHRPVRGVQRCAGRNVHFTARYLYGWGQRGPGGSWHQSASSRPHGRLNSWPRSWIHLLDTVEEEGAGQKGGTSASDCRAINWAGRSHQLVVSLFSHFIHSNYTSCSELSISPLGKLISFIILPLVFVRKVFYQIQGKTEQTTHTVIYKLIVFYGFTCNKVERFTFYLIFVFHFLKTYGT